MKIKDVIVHEGVGDWLKSTGRELGGAAKQIGKDLAGGRGATTDKEFYRNMANRFQTGRGIVPPRGSVYVVKNPADNQTYFKSYQDKWYKQDPANPEVFNISQEVKDSSKLDDLLFSADKDKITVDVTPGPNSSTFFRDTGRETDTAPTPTAPAPQAGQQANTNTGGWVDLPGGVQLLPGGASNPTFAKYNKQVYRLTTDDRWVDVRDKPISQTMTALLNHALSQT